jgi:drug/metabolite transporter (DMT)-like permease
MLVGVSVHLTAQHVLGDALALITALFYGAYLLTVKYLRRSFSPAMILAGSGIVSCVFLLLIAFCSNETVHVRSGRGWAVLWSLALISHVGGQGLIAYALAHLPAGFSSVALLLQPVVAAILAWVVLGEPLSLAQSMGGCVVLAGIAVATRSADVVGGGGETIPESHADATRDG